MSTEQKPAPTPPAPAAPATPTPHAKHEPKAEPNALAQSLAGGWDKFKQGKLISYPLMALILVAVAGIGVAIYITRSNAKANSAKWVELDALETDSFEALEEFAGKNPGTPQGRIAALRAACGRLGPAGVDRFATADPDTRKKAVENVEKARDAFPKLVDEFKDDPLIKPLCLLGAAKAEAVLVGMTKEGQLDQFRGDPKKAVEWLDKVAEAAPDTDWGKDCQKLADLLRNQNTQEQVRTLQMRAYTIETPSLGGFDPKMPHGFGP